MSYARGEACQEVTTVQDLDLEAYVSKRWYVHQQAVTEYSPLEWNYCTYAEYAIRNRQTFWGYRVDVTNYAEDVNGTEFGGPLCAAQNRRESGKLSVAPCFLPRFIAGPYWIIAYDEAEGYALVSGGQPTISGPNGCRTGDGINNSGLWIFSRSPDRNETLIDQVRGIAEDQGFDLGVLNDVLQVNCTYDEEPPEVPCEDSDESFRVFRFGPSIDCDYVARNPGHRCWLSRGNCPATCNEC
uniref:Uncharacterized protein n=1 Tax=Cyclophora tenuis TaxID=216820 RepID=A0A7S1GRJ1_CYCTE